MIGWKADYGFSNDKTGDSEYTHLSQFTMCDSSIFCIVTKFNSDSPLVGTRKDYTPIEGQSLLENAFGRDFATLYMRPAEYWKNYGTTIASNLFGYSIQSACPNLYMICEGFVASQDYRCTCMHLKSLKRLIVSHPTSSGQTSVVYRVKDDGSLTKLYSGGHFYTTGQQSGFPFIYNYHEGIDLSDYKNYYSFSATTNTAMFRSMTIHTSGNSIVQYLFGDNRAPDFVDTVPEPAPDPDPPEGDIDTGTKLPGGYDPDSDEIPDGIDNWLSASALGMCTVYNPTKSQVKDLATRLFSKDFQSGFENYIWGNPIESIIGLSVFPCPIPDGGTATVKSWGLDTGVTMTLAGSTMVHVDCGSLPVPNVYEGYLDYSPYTQAEIYIPYVGFVGLDADDIMGQNLQLHYYIDIISGSATAKLVISNTSTTTVLGQWACQVGRQIPIGAKDYNDIINAGVQLVTAAVGAYSGSVIPEIVTDLGDALQYEGGGFNGTKFATQMLRAGSSAIMQAKPNITRGSAIASASGQLAVQTPYLILKRPVSAKTNGYGALVGYPTFKYGNIGAYTGFVRCHNIKLDGIGCTDWELSEIFRLCCEGVYI